MKPILAALLLFACAALHAANFTTQSWHTTIDVQRNRTLKVTEDIEVTFTIPQHGIIRRIPFFGNGKRVRYTLLKAEIRRGGSASSAPADHRISAENDDWVVRIGSASSTVEGHVSYRLSYEVIGAVGHFDADGSVGAHDEVYYNAIPAAWATGVDKVAVEVKTPQPKTREYKARILAGPEGSRWGLELSLAAKPVGDAKLIHASLVPGDLKAEITRDVPKGYGVTVALAMPPGTLDDAPVEAPDAFPPPFLDTAPEGPGIDWGAWAIGGLMPFTPLPFLLLFVYATKPRVGPLVVQFEPPANVDAASSGLLIDGKVDQRDIVAGILQVAAKGAFQIDNSHGATTIRVLPKSTAQNLTEFEHEVHNAISAFGDTVTLGDLRGNFGPHFASLTYRLELDASMSGWYGGLSGKSRLAAWLYGIAVLAVGVFWVSGSPLFAPLGIVVSIIVGVAILGKASTWSDTGAQVRHKVLGLREFVTRAHEKELDYMSRVSPSQALFEKLLPFAVAFGAVKQWSQAFAGIDMASPSWYVADQSRSDWSTYFALQLFDMSSDMGRAVSAPSPILTTSSSSSSSSGDSGFGGSWSSGSDSGSSWDSGGGFSGGGDVGGGSAGGGGDSW